ncbi:MAG: HAMP domain-containing sensor histidine kinase [Sedimentibacter sp.]|uniref:HAMP domain-containing sensor histidine kinase n=1 Tax=Sedimentibacter sp. TaxID=1960295 RepID=UPI0031596669
MKKMRFNRIGLTIAFSFLTFSIFLITSAIISFIVLLSVKMGLIDVTQPHNRIFFMIIPLLFSVAIGTMVSFITGPVFLKPIRKIIDATNKLARGDFSVRLNITKPPELVELSDSFNQMAEELGGIEVLRSDFVNNFSHEFKTPIVSIKGFAEMLKHDDLTQEERDEYLDIIIDESVRLASLATNVLYMSKIETQSILTERNDFNAGEHLRQCILILEAKFSKKNVEINADIQDFNMRGNKEMLSQVWVNLLDNAIKFSDEGGTVEVVLRQEANEAVALIMDNGCGIDENSKNHIFDKFYQADKSHATSGNGIGLAVAKKIVDLHGGTITFESEPDRGTVFCVRLPVGC